MAENSKATVWRVMGVTSYGSSSKKSYDVCAIRSDDIRLSTIDIMQKYANATLVSFDMRTETHEYHEGSIIEKGEVPRLEIFEKRLFEQREKSKSF